MRRVALVLGLVLAVGARAEAGPCGDEDAVAAVRALCDALDAGDAAAARVHLRLPLRVKAIVSENAGNPRFRRRKLRSVAAVRRARVCADAQLDAATASGGAVSAARGQFEVVFTTARRGDRCVVTAVEDR